LVIPQVRSIEIVEKEEETDTHSHTHTLTHLHTHTEYVGREANGNFQVNRFTHLNKQTNNNGNTGADQLIILKS